MQKFPDLPFKTVTKLVQKRQKPRKNCPKIFQFIGQKFFCPKSSKMRKNRQKISQFVDQNSENNEFERDQN